MMMATCLGIAADFGMDRVELAEEDKIGRASCRERVS
jgi:hypothetical protein